MNRRFFERAWSLVSFRGGSAVGDRAGRGSHAKRDRNRRLGFESCERRELLAVTVTGTKFDTVSSSGFTPGQDKPLANVTINLFQDANTNQVLDAGDGATIGSTTTAANGTYSLSVPTSSDGLNHYFFIQEVVPAGYTQSTGPLFYTLVEKNGAIFSATTTNIDNFSDPDPASSFFISAESQSVLHANRTAGAGGDRWPA